MTHRSLEIWICRGSGGRRCSQLWSAALPVVGAAPEDAVVADLALAQTHDGSEIARLQLAWAGEVGSGARDGGFVATFVA